MKTDRQLQQDVTAELEFDPRVDHARIGVSVADGVVTLTGLVTSYAEKLSAERATRRVAGVRAIAEEIKVRYPSDPKTDDSEIAKRISDIFEWDVTVPHERLTIQVEHGLVALDGLVDWHFQREAAAKAAGKIHGVRGISNRIVVKPLPLAGDVRDRIAAAIRRSAETDAAAIGVTAEGGKVTLTGRVKTWRERAAAERMTWATAGVADIENNIIVAS